MKLRTYFIMANAISIAPIEKSLRRITLEAKNIAEGTLKAEVPITGPREFRYLAEQFNEMSSNLQQSFHQIQSAEAQRRELVANVSHDLRTPLASFVPLWRHYKMMWSKMKPLNVTFSPFNRRPCVYLI